MSVYPWQALPGIALDVEFLADLSTINAVCHNCFALCTSTDVGWQWHDLRSEPLTVSGAPAFFFWRAQGRAAPVAVPIAVPMPIPRPQGVDFGEFGENVHLNDNVEDVFRARGNSMPARMNRPVRTSGGPPGKQPSDRSPLAADGTATVCAMCPLRSRRRHARRPAPWCLFVARLRLRFSHARPLSVSRVCSVAGSRVTVRARALNRPRALIVVP